MIELDTLSVRVMDHADVAAVHAIDSAVYSRPWSTSLWRAELGDTSRQHLVAVHETGVVGHAGFVLMAGDAHVTTVAVDPSWQGRSVATRLMLALLERAVGCGVDAATLEVRAQDRRAQRLYLRMGFRPSGLRPRYYRDPTDDAVVMWLPELGGIELRDRLDALRSAIDGDRRAAGSSTAEEWT